MWATPQAFSPGSREGRVGRGRGVGARPPHPPPRHHPLDAPAEKLTRRLERQPPCPHRGEPAREPDSLRDPDINAVRRAGLRVRVRARRARHSTCARGRAGRGRGTAPGPGVPRRAGEDSPRRVPTSPKLSWRPPPSLPPSPEQAAIARWFELLQSTGEKARFGGADVGVRAATTPSCSGKS